MGSTSEHHRLEEEFLTKATLEFTFEEAVEESKTTPISSRELYVEDRSLNIRGFIDEVILKPDAITVIDDKPIGKSGKVYPSSKRQVFGYCIALKTMLGSGEARPIIAAVRARGTDRIVWSQLFDAKAERLVKGLITRIHGLVAGDLSFKSALQAYKCKPCRFFSVCDRRVEQTKQRDAGRR
jgi:hypothetical protein